MSKAAPKRHAYDEHQEAELARWQGVDWYREVRGKHYAIVLAFNGVSRFVIYPSSPGDTTRGALNHLTDLRGALRQIGASRTVEQRNAQPRRRRNRSDQLQLVRGEQITGGPARDPWAALASLKIEPSAPPSQPPPRPHLWRRLLQWFFPTHPPGADQ